MKDYTVKELKEIASTLRIGGLSGKNKAEIKEILLKENVLIDPPTDLMTGEMILKEKELQKFFKHGYKTIEPRRYGLRMGFGSYSGIMYGKNNKYRFVWTRGIIHNVGIFWRPSKSMFTSPEKLVELLERAMFMKFK